MFTVFFFTNKCISLSMTFSTISYQPSNYCGPFRNTVKYDKIFLVQIWIQIIYSESVLNAENKIVFDEENSKMDPLRIKLKNKGWASQKHKSLTTIAVHIIYFKKHIADPIKQQCLLKVPIFWRQRPIDEAHRFNLVQLQYFEQEVGIGNVDVSKRLYNTSHRGLLGKPLRMLRTFNFQEKTI